MEILILNNFESENSNHGRVCVRMHVVYLFWFFFLSWQLPTRAKAGWWMTDDRSFQCLQRCSRQDALGRRDCSEQFEILTKTLSSLYVTYHFQLTITNLLASCLPPIDDGSFKCLQRCSWQAVPGTMMALNSSNDKLWHCFSLIWHPILSWQLPTG